MDNNLSSAVLVGTGSSTLPLLNAAKENVTPKYHASLLYKVDDENATEAMVMDALENRDASVGDYNTTVNGRNGLTLTPDGTISAEVDYIVNGVDNNPIDLRNESAGVKVDNSGFGKAVEITIGSLTQGTYAFVYDYTWESASDPWTTSTTYTNKTTNEVVVYEQITPASASAIGSKEKYYSITPDALDNLTASADAVTVDNAHLYFSKTTNGTGTTTYSYISVFNKVGTTLPKGVVVVDKSDTTTIVEVNGTDAPVSGTFYFDKFFSNEGKYAVKVFKVIN